GRRDPSASRAWSSDVCPSDLDGAELGRDPAEHRQGGLVRAEPHRLTGRDGTPRGGVPVLAHRGAPSSSSVPVTAPGYCSRSRSRSPSRSEEHTSELQSRENLVCRLLLGK